MSEKKSAGFCVYSFAAGRRLRGDNGAQFDWAWIETTKWNTRSPVPTESPRYRRRSARPRFARVTKPSRKRDCRPPLP